MEVWVFLRCSAVKPVIIVGEEGRDELIIFRRWLGGGRKHRRTVVGASKREACYTDKAEAMAFFSAFTALIYLCILLRDFPTTDAAEV